MSEEIKRKQEMSSKDYLVIFLVSIMGLLILVNIYQALGTVM